MKYRNAYELEDGRIHVEIFDEGFDDWANWVVDPNDESTKEIWSELKVRGNYLTYAQWLEKTREERAEQEKREAILCEIARRKELLNSTDYQAIKYAEGAISEEDYAPIKAQRAAWRDEINALEEKLHE